MPHGGGGLKTFVKNNPGVGNELVKCNIFAIFSGHIHQASGYDSDWEIKSTKSNMTLNIPTYYIGLRVYQKMSSAGFVYYGSDVFSSPCTTPLTAVAALPIRCPRRSGPRPQILRLVRIRRQLDSLSTVYELGISAYYRLCISLPENKSCAVSKAQTFRII